MKIGIVSDTHNNWANFKKAIDWMNKEKIEMILHCGDIQSQDIIDQSKKAFIGKIDFVKGNADFNLSDLPDQKELKADDKKIIFVHFPAEAKKLAQSGKYDIVFYGHTHKAWEEKVGNCRMINPGELAGQFFKPTFATYDTITGELELKILEKI